MGLMILDCVVDLRRGIESGEIVPYYQPLTELRTGQLIGFEVLARWKHPLRGMVPPDEFIRMAEEAGLHRGVDGADPGEGFPRDAALAGVSSAVD